MSKNIVRQAVPTAGGTTGTADNVLMRITSSVSVAAAPYKYLAAIYKAQYNPDGSPAAPIQTGLQLWLSDKELLATESDRWYFGQKRGDHYEGIKKKR